MRSERPWAWWPWQQCRSTARSGDGLWHRCDLKKRHRGPHVKEYGMWDYVWQDQPVWVDSVPRSAQVSLSVDQIGPEAARAWRVAHDALAAHGRARMAGAPEGELRRLWEDYCLALCTAVDAG